VKVSKNKKIIDVPGNLGLSKVLGGNETTTGRHKIEKGYADTDIERDFEAQLVRERGNNVLGDGPVRRDGDDSGGERNEDATRQEAI